MAVTATAVSATVARQEEEEEGEPDSCRFARPTEVNKVKCGWRTKLKKESGNVFRVLEELRKLERK